MTFSLLLLLSRGFQFAFLSYSMALYILALTLLSICYESNAASQQGRVGLWSDSECNSKSGDTSNFGEPDPVSLNFTLLPDVCGVPGATVHSYRVLQNATCANGTTAMFDYYNRNNCTADPTDEDPNPGLAKRMKYRRQNSVLDGECLALIAFNSLAFICEGVDPRDLKVNSLSTSMSSPNTLITSSMFTSISSSNHLATATNSTATTLFGETSSTTISAVTASPTTSNSGSKSRLSGGTSAGIGVGSAVGILAIAALLFFFSRRYKIIRIKESDRHSDLISANPAMTTSSGTRGPDLGTTPQVFHEAGVGQPHEVGGVAVNTMHEVGIENEIHEMANPRTNLDS